MFITSPTCRQLDFWLYASIARASAVFHHWGYDLPSFYRPKDRNILREPSRPGHTAARSRNEYSAHLLAPSRTFTHPHTPSHTFTHLHRRAGSRSGNGTTFTQGFAGDPRIVRYRYVSARTE